jgi:hypothetical protein
MGCMIFPSQPRLQQHLNCHAIPTVVKIRKRAWRWYWRGNPYQACHLYSHSNLSQVFLHSFRTSAPKRVKVCPPDASQQQFVFWAVWIGWTTPQLVKHASIAFERSHHVIPSSSRQVLFFVFLRPLSPIRYQSILIVCGLFPALVLQLCHME